MTYEVFIGDDAEGQMSHLPCKEAPFVAGMCGEGGFLSQQVFTRCPRALSSSSTCFPGAILA